MADLQWQIRHQIFIQTSYPSGFSISTCSDVLKSALIQLEGSLWIFLSLDGVLGAMRFWMKSDFKTRRCLILKTAKKKRKKRPAQIPRKEKIRGTLVRPLSYPVAGHCITTGGTAVILSSRAFLISFDINVRCTSTQIPSPTPQCGKGIRPLCMEPCHAHPMRGC